MKPLTRADLLAALTTLRVETTDEPLLGGTVTYRELSAAARQLANDAAVAAGGAGDPDNVLYRAIVVQLGVIDPDTHEPLLTGDDVAALRNGRERVIDRLALQILKLSEALPGDLKSGNHPADQG